MEAEAEAQRNGVEAWDQLQDYNNPSSSSSNKPSRTYAEILAEAGVDTQSSTSYPSNPAHEGIEEGVEKTRGKEEEDNDEKKKSEIMRYSEVREKLEAELEKAEERERELEEEEEEIGELIDMQFARPEKDEMDCESICSTYSNLLNHPKVVA